MIPREPVRGSLPDAAFYGLPGLEQARLWARGAVGVPPLGRLVGFRATQASAGSLAATLPASPWLTYPDGTLDVQIGLELAASGAALTAAGPGREVRVMQMSVNHLRACTGAGDTLVARGRVVTSGRTVTFVEAEIDDGFGRPTARASVSVAFDPIEWPIDRALEGALARGDEPTYATPDPHQRPLPREVFPFRIWLDEPGLPAIRQLVAGTLPAVPIHALLGVREVDAADGMFAATIPASPWFCGMYPRVQPGVLMMAFTMTMSGCGLTLSPGGRTVGVLGQSVSFLRRVEPDGRVLLVRAVALHREGDLVVVQGEMTDADGNRVAIGHETLMLVDRRTATRQQHEPERVLTTVLFTDIVNSTPLAEQLGDDRWRERLAEHNAIVRRQIDLFHGREVKTIGDSFMVTFDTPARAVRCARAICDGLRRIGLDVRAGVHTGECEVVGADLTGIGVVVAERIKSAASGGEVLVSSTVRDLVAGSGLHFADHGRHTLKGIEGEWQVYAATD